MRHKNINLLLVLFLLLSNCSLGGNEDIEESAASITSSTTSTTSSTIEISPSTTTTTVTIEEECVEDNNKNTNFEKMLNVQIFLNKYGFDAGDEDGYLGQQTANAIRDFQSYVGLDPDGDVGPNTINKMKEFTGCEDRVNSYASNSNSDATTTTTTIPSTTTTIPNTTTTTIVAANSSETENRYGHVPSVSLSSNEVVSLFKGVENSDSICGTPYIQSLNTGVDNLYSNGSVPSTLNVSNNSFTQSSNTTEIFEEDSNQIKIKIVGDGNTDYNFYFIPPFSSRITNIKPTSVSTSLNLTEATFNLEGLSEGVWFYSFAEAGGGTVIKASGNREFSVGTTSSQQVTSHTGVSKVLITSKNNSSEVYKNLTAGEAFSTTDNLNIVYITDAITDNRLDTSDEIKIDDSVIKLSNENQAFIGEVLLVDNELMKVTAKDGKNYTVQRGYLNTEIRDYTPGASVKAIKNFNQETIISDSAYLVFRNETGMRFQVLLGKELTANQFNLFDCNFDRYSLEKITTFSWRSSGSSSTTTTTSEDILNPLFNKSFVINSNGSSYTPPSITSADEISGEFLNSGPKNQIVNVGDIVRFNFNGIVDGSSEAKFAKFKFQMIPDTGSNKKTKYKDIYLTVNNEEYNFSLNINKIVSNESYKSDTWENDYKYIFKSITLFDTSTSVEILNDQTIRYDYKSQIDSHEVYYLDQFSFVVPNN